MSSKVYTKLVIGQRFPWMVWIQTLVWRMSPIFCQKALHVHWGTLQCPSNFQVCHITSLSACIITQCLSEMWENHLLKSFRTCTEPRLCIWPSVFSEICQSFSKLPLNISFSRFPIFFWLACSAPKVVMMPQTALVFHNSCWSLYEKVLQTIFFFH